MRLSHSRVAVAFGAIMGACSAIQVDTSSTSSLKDAARQSAYDMMVYYVGNQTGQTPGLIPYLNPSGQVEYWWEAGGMFGALVDYWYLTGDAGYNDVTTQGLLWQAGPSANFEPSNQTLDLGNDDQAFWAFTVMQAAEYNFPNPPTSEPQWLELAQAVFNRQVPRWDTTSCNGGLRWQIFEFNSGYDYKNTISNACLFQLGARLAKYTGNTTYSDWAVKAYDWMTSVGLITDQYIVYDGTDSTTGCTSINHLQWSYNAAVTIYGAAVMWNITGSSTWYDRTEGLIKATSVFFTNGIMFEVACETTGDCNSDQQSFKAYMSRYLAATTRVAPWTLDLVQQQLESSATAAGKACTGGSSGTQCGLRWTTGSYDGETGIGEEMSALEVFLALLMMDSPTAGPITAKSGGTSKGNPGAGSNEAETPPGYFTNAITSADRAGAGILTTLVCFAIVGGAIWMLL